jgi:hypothetical protein
MERAVKLGVLSIDQYTAAVAAAGFNATDQGILRATVLAEVAQTAQASARRNSISRALGKRGVSLAQEEQLVRDGIIPVDAYAQFLVQNGYGEPDVSNLAALLRLKIEQQQATATLHAAAAAKATDRDISLGAEQAAVIAGDRTPADYQALLSDLGYDQVDQSTLMADLAAKVAAARAKAAKTPTPPAAATAPVAF